MNSKNTSLFKTAMGVSGYFAFIAKCGYLPTQVRLKQSDSFVVDTKLFMYKKASGISSDCEDLALNIANQIDNMFKLYPNVLLLNDGRAKVSPLKCTTLLNRKIKREEAQAIADTQAAKLEEEPHTEVEIRAMQDDIEKKARVARGVSTDMSMEVLRILREDRGYKTLQCQGEADAILIQLSPFFTYVVSEDSDLLIGGVTNLLRGFRNDNKLYSAPDILKQINLFNLQEFEAYEAFKKLPKPKKSAKRQKLDTPKEKPQKNPKACSYYPLNQKHLQEIACIMGCDYTIGVQSIGFKTGMELLMKNEGVCSDLVTFISKDPEKYGVCEDLLGIINAASALFRPEKLENFSLENFTNSEDFFANKK